MQIKRFGQCCAFLTSLLLVCTSFAEAPLSTVIDNQLKIEQAAQKSQQKIDQLDEQTAQLLAEYRSVTSQTESLKAYNDQLDKLIASQQNELVLISEQLDNIVTTQRDIVPLMLNMLKVLEQFVALDIPFLLDERQQRIAELKQLMERADVTLAEKYRRLIEAYQVEAEYGRTIEAYQGQLEVNGEMRTVNFLRLGRVALYYQTLDEQQAGYWQQGWREVDSSYFNDINTALKTAKKQLPPSLLVLPMAANGVER